MRITKKTNRSGTNACSGPSRISGVKASAAKTTFMMVDDCPSSPFGIHVPDSFTLEGDFSHAVAEFESVRFSISCKCCRKQGVGVIALADIHWND